MDREKIIGYLNIAKKAGFVIIGGEKLYNYNKKLYLALFDSTAKKNTIKVVEKLKERGVSTLKLDGLDSIMNINNCKIIGIKNKNLSEIICKLCDDKN